MTGWGCDGIADRSRRGGRISVVVGRFHERKAIALKTLIEFTCIPPVFVPAKAESPLFPPPARHWRRRVHPQLTEGSEQVVPGAVGGLLTLPTNPSLTTESAASSTCLWSSDSPLRPTSLWPCAIWLASPCQSCAKLIMQAGIEHVIAEYDYHSSGPSKDLFDAVDITYKITKPGEAYTP